MEENKVNKRIYFWVTGERFDKENISRIYNEMKYNFYLPLIWKKQKNLQEKR